MLSQSTAKDTTQTDLCTIQYLVNLLALVMFSLFLFLLDLV